VSAGVSVVVPARESNDTLGALFESLARARAELPAPSEVIVVDDSGPASRAALERLCALHDVRLVPGGRHVGAKRNLGVAAAVFDVLLFVDSDCRASPALLREHWTTCASAGACAGPVEFAGPRSWLWPGLELLGVPTGFRQAASGRRLLWAATANLSVRRSCFEAAGGFDETLPSPGGGEDVDLGLRLTGRGVVIQGNPRALVLHKTSTWNSPGAMLVRLARYGRNEPALLERHPGRGTTAPPGHLTLLVPGAALWLAVGLLAHGAGQPWLAALWAAAYLAAWFARVLALGRPDRGLLHSMAAAVVLELAYEAGRLASCWRRRHPGWMLRRLVLDERQVAAEWTNGSARTWCWCAATALCALVWIALGR